MEESGMPILKQGVKDLKTKTRSTYLPNRPGKSGNRMLRLWLNLKVLKKEGLIMHETSVLMVRVR